MRRGCHGSILGTADLWRCETESATLARMDREIEALNKARGHVADIATLVEMARGHTEEGRFEDASACLHLIEQHASIGRESLSGLLKGWRD